MSVIKLNKNINNLANSIFSKMLKNEESNEEVQYYNFSYDQNRQIVPDKGILSLLEKRDSEFCIYGIKVEKNSFSELRYIGKTEQDSERLRQHLTGKNKNGTWLADSVSTKHEDIVQSFYDDFNHTLCCFYNKNLNKYSFIALESCLIDLAKSDFNSKKSKFDFDIDHWNNRNG